MTKLSKKRWNWTLEQLGLRELNDSIELARDRLRKEKVEESGGVKKEEGDTIEVRRSREG